MSLEFKPQASYLVGKPVKMSQKHRDLKIVVILYLYSEEVTQRKKQRKKERKEKNGGVSKGVINSGTNSGSGCELILEGHCISAPGRQQF